MGPHTTGLEPARPSPVPYGITRRTPMKRLKRLVFEELDWENCLVWGFLVAWSAGFLATLVYLLFTKVL
jgi:hypothetical protein